MGLIRKRILTTAIFVFGVLLVFLAIAFFGEVQTKKARSLFQETKNYSSDKPSVGSLPAIEPMTIEQALILQDVGGLSATTPKVEKRWYPPAVAVSWPPALDFAVDYVGHSSGDARTSQLEMTVTVWVSQLPDEAWPLYFAKYSPVPDILPQNRSLVLSLVKKFGNEVVVDRQFRDPKETGKLMFFWPSKKNFVTIIYYSTAVNEEFLRRYLQKYPSSL
jgi:hypothetical protein